MKIIARTTFLSFEDQEDPKRKSLLIHVVSKSNGAVLGEVKWFGRWRQYCFFPAPGTVFNVGCLEDINDTIADLMDKRKFAVDKEGEEITDVLPQPKV